MTCCRSLRLPSAWGLSDFVERGWDSKGPSEDPAAPSPTCPPTSGV